MGRLISIALAVTVMGVMAAPGAATASPVLTSADNPGVPIPVGKTLDTTSNNVVWSNTSLGTLACATVAFQIEVTENSGTRFQADGVGGATAGCEASGRPLTVTSPTLVHLETTTGMNGLLSISFIADVGSFQCTYEGEGAFIFGTGPDAKVEIADIELASPAELCEPEEGHSHFSGDFALTTAGGVEVFPS